MSRPKTRYPKRLPTASTSDPTLEAFLACFRLSIFGAMAIMTLVAVLVAVYGTEALISSTLFVPYGACVYPWTKVFPQRPPAQPPD